MGGHYIAQTVLIFEARGLRVEYPNMAEADVQRILRNQNWLRRNWCAPDCLWPGDSWRLA